MTNMTATREMPVEAMIGHPELEKPAEELRRGMIRIIPTVHWLHEISEDYRARGYKGPDFTLGTVPDAVWQKYHDQGFKAMYFVGVFQRDPKAKEFAERWADEYVGASPPNFDKNTDVLGSPFAHVGYKNLDPHVVDAQRGWQEFDDFSRKLQHKFGIRVGVDYVPNHTGIGHHRIGDYHFYLHGNAEWFHREPGRFIDTFMDDENKKRYTPTERPFYVRHIDQDGKEYLEEYHILHGDEWREPGQGMLWEDTAQINLANEDVQEKMIQYAIDLVINHEVRMLRVDMAHITLPEEFGKKWGFLHDQVTPEGLQALGTFWRRFIDRVKAAAESKERDVIVIAEAYSHHKRLMDLGFDFVYGSEFTHNAREVAKGGPVAWMREFLGKTPWLKRLLLHIENHDLDRARETLHGDAPARAMMMVAGMIDAPLMIMDGQEESRITRPPNATRTVRDERGDDPRRLTFNKWFYEKVFYPWRTSSLYKNGVYSEPPFDPEYGGDEHLIVQQLTTNEEGRLSVVNLSGKEKRSCLVHLPRDAKNIHVYDWDTGAEVRPIAPLLDYGDHFRLSVTIHHGWQGQYITFDRG